MDVNRERWREVSRIYGAVVARPQEERAATVTELCRGDQGLREEVESLLAEEARSLVIDRGMSQVAASVDNEPASLKAGFMLGPYRLDAPIGAGGMGQVFRATDTRLNRTVAIKVLPPALANDPQFQARFDREARAIASLSHPHICTLHDVGRDHGVEYLVMEYLEGETLAARLERGALPLDDALRHAAEIADALATAHRLGIVHRDLKPGNIFLVRTSGTSAPPIAKLLDFGLAKTSAPAGVASQLSMLPTTPPNLTAQGTILGTFQYMAPEQLEGREADTRTDIFAFGAVVYEMVTGKKAFEGKSQASLIGAIMHAEPPSLTALQPLTPRTLDRMIRKCLAKDPEQRWQSVQDLASELRWIVDAPPEIPASPALLSRRRSLALVVGAALALVFATAVVAAWLFSRPEANSAVVRFTISPPVDANWANNPGGGAVPLAVSPDGNWIVFGVLQRGTALLWVRSLDTTSSRQLPGTEGARYPFWSPDSRSIGFFTQNELKRIDIAGGTAQKICDAENGGGGTWRADGSILFSQFRQGFFLISERGGSLTRIPSSILEARVPWFLPDGQHYLFVASSSELDQGGGLYLGSVDGSEAARLVEGARGAAYESGHILFVRGETLFAQPFEASAQRLTGRAVPVADAVGLSINGSAAFSVSASGVLAHAGMALSRRQIMWTDRTGHVTDRVGGPNVVTTLQLSADERRILTTRIDPRTGLQSLWLTDAERKVDTRIDDGNNGLVSPDGKWIVAVTPPPAALKRWALAGQRQPEPLVADRRTVWPTDWSLDGRFILIEHVEARTNFDISVLDPTTREIRPLVQTRANDGQGRFSPDQRWVAYASDDSGRPEILVRPFLRSGEAIPISTVGGTQPRWRRDGKELFYLSEDHMITAVDIDSSGDSLRVGPPKPLFSLRVPTSTLMFGSDYAPANNGMRFLVDPVVDEGSANDITVVLNWTAALPE